MKNKRRLKTGWGIAIFYLTIIICTMLVVYANNH